MYPTLFRLGGVAVPTHDFFVVLGAGVALAVFGIEARRRAVASRVLWTIAAGSLLGGAVFAKASTAWRYVADTGDFSFTGILIHGGKSVLGGLAGAYLGAIVTKRLVGYTASTGDVFAPAVALGIAVGRIGCFLTEPIGTPTGLPWGFTPPLEVAARIPNCPQCLEGIPLHPSLLYEVAFCLLAWAGLEAARRRVRVPGDLFKLFLLSYGVFRFLVEFVRGHSVMALGLTGSQLFLAATLPLLIGYFLRQIIRGAYRPSTPARLGAAR